MAVFNFINQIRAILILKLSDRVLYNFGIGSWQKDYFEVVFWVKVGIAIWDSFDLIFEVFIIDN